MHGFSSSVSHLFVWIGIDKCLQHKYTSLIINKSDAHSTTTSRKDSNALMTPATQELTTAAIGSWW